MKAFAAALLLLALVSGASAAEQSTTSFRVRTVATIPTRVSAFANGDRYLAWVVVPPVLGCATVVMQNLRTRARTSMRERCDIAAGHPRKMVAAGADVYWEALGASNLTEYSTLVRGSARTRMIHDVAFQSIYSGGFGTIVPPASDGRNVYFWTSPEDGTPGPIRRFNGRGSSLMTSTVRNLSALGAGEGRWAFAQAKRTFDCAQGPTWYPSGSIAFASAGTRACRGGIWVISANGTGARRLVASGRNPDWSPGGELAYDDGGAVKVVFGGGGTPRIVIEHGTNPAWSPDGTEIAFERGDTIVVAEARGGAERVLVTEAADPDWSPDGKEVVFARTAERNLGLGIVAVDGGGVRSLTSGGDWEPAWSPNGLRIAFTHCTYAQAGCPHASTQIVEIAPDGSGRRARTPDDAETDDSAPAWGPGSQLAFARSRDWQDEGDSHIFSGSRQLTPHTRSQDARCAAHCRGRDPRPSLARRRGGRPRGDPAPDGRSHAREELEARAAAP